ncbi:hypothetical protein [Nocardiopsis alkaliphila]|uniref:hypothetical protein n=1 Tax=Nocardiopsis alkaliphila TaxID=225762 RepID=UPI000344ABA6
MATMTNHSQGRDEIAAALRAGRELGPEYDDAIAASLVERVEDTIEERVKHHVALHSSTTRADKGVASNTARMVLGLVCLGLSLPLTIIAAGIVGGVVSLFTVWLGLIAFYLIAVAGMRR